MFSYLPCIPYSPIGKLNLPRSNADKRFPGASFKPINPYKPFARFKASIPLGRCPATPAENRALGSGDTRYGILGLMFEGICYDFLGLPLPRDFMPSSLLLERFMSTAVRFPTSNAVILFTVWLNLRNPVIFIFLYVCVYSHHVDPVYLTAPSVMLWQLPVCEYNPRVQVLISSRLPIYCVLISMPYKHPPQ